MSAQVFARGLFVSHYVRKSWFRGNPGNFCLWNPESLGFKIRNWAQGIWNPGIQDLESRIEDYLWFTSHGRFVPSTLKLLYMGKQVKWSLISKRSLIYNLWVWYIMIFCRPFCSPWMRKFWKPWPSMIKHMTEMKKTRMNCCAVATLNDHQLQIKLKKAWVYNCNCLPLFLIR